MAASLKGQVISYFIDVAQGRRVTLHALCKAVGKNYENPTERQQVLHAIANVMRDRRDGLDRAPIDIQNIVPAAVWYQADYVAPNPPHEPAPWTEEEAAAEPARREASAQRDLADRVSAAGPLAAENVIVYEHIGTNKSGASVLRDSDGGLWLANPL